MKSKKPHDYSEIINVLVLIAIVVLFVAVYIAGTGKNGLKSVAIKTEQAYVNKAEDIKAAKKALKKESPEKDKIPYNKYSFNYTYIIDVKGNADVVTFKVAVPKDEKEKQYISELNLSPKPARTYSDGVNNIAEFKFTNVKTGKLNVVVSGIVNQRTYDYETAKVLNRNPHKEADLSQYLKPAYLIESNDASIIKTAQTLRGKTQLETVENTFNFVSKNLKYNVSTKLMGAKDVLKIKQGKCMDYSNLMIALLRANNIPSRYVVGYMIKDGGGYHAWVEVYYEKYGWVAYDPTMIAMPLSYKDASGQIHKETATIEPSKSHGRRYIASARNMVSAYQASMQTSGKSRPSLSLEDRPQIKKVQ